MRAAARGGAPGFGAPGPQMVPRAFGAFGAAGPPQMAAPGRAHPNLGGLFASGGGGVPPKMPRGAAAQLSARDSFASGYSDERLPRGLLAAEPSGYSAFGGGGLGLFASVPGFITTTRAAEPAPRPGAREPDITRRSP